MKKETSASRGAILLLLVAMLLGAIVGFMFAQSWQSWKRQSSNTLQKIEQVLSLVDKRYVDTLNIDSVGEVAVAHFLSELDPHSTYLSPKMAAKTLEEQNGGFEGTGLVLRQMDDTIYIGGIESGGPSDGLDFLPGDMLVAVDGWPTAGNVLDSVVPRVRGPRGTTVELVTVRYPADTIHNRVRRGRLTHHSVSYHGMINDTTGYIRLESFTLTSADEFEQALFELKRKGMTHLVFDLRGNSGGMLMAAIDIASEMLPEGSLILYTEGVHSKRKNTYSHAHGLFTQGRISVLIDEHSASASEVVSGALQDNDRATIYGRRSFGKGLVQTEFPLNDGAVLLLTTARYYTPSGRCIQRSYNEGTEAYYRTYLQQLMEESYADTIRTTIYDSTPYYTTYGRIVYGGGGITPDVPLTYRHDPSFAYYNELVGSGAVYHAAFQYVRRHAAQIIAKYPSADDFYHHFTVSDALLQQAVQEGVARGVAINSKSLAAQRLLLTNLMKAYIGQCFYGEGMFQRTLLQTDDDLNKIIQQ